MVITVLTVLFLTTLSQLILQWYFINLCFVQETNNRVDTFLISLLGVPVVIILFTILAGTAQIFADALLVGAQLPNRTVQVPD